MALLHVGASPAVYTDFPSHRHDCYEIILNVEGTGTARIGEREYPFSPGTIQVIPPDTPHRKWAKKGFRDLYLHTDTLRCSAAPGEADPDGPLLLADDASRTMEHLLSVLLGRFSLGMERDEISRILLDTVFRLIADWSRTEPADPVVGAIVKYGQPALSGTYTVSFNGNSGNVDLVQDYEFIPGTTKGLLNADSRLFLDFTLSLDGAGNYELLADSYAMEAGKRCEIGDDTGLGLILTTKAEGTYVDNGDGTVTTSPATHAVAEIYTDTYSEQMRGPAKLAVGEHEEDGTYDSNEYPEVLDLVPETVWTLADGAIVSYLDPNAEEESKEEEKPAEAPAADGVTIVSDDEGTTMTFFPDGSYRFDFESYGIVDEGSYTYADGVLTLTDVNGLQYTADGDPMHLHYGYSGAPDQLTGEYTIPADSFDFDEISSLTIVSDDRGTTITLIGDGTYRFWFEAYQIEDLGTWQIADGILSLTDANGKETRVEGAPYKLHYVYSMSDQLTGDFTIDPAIFAEKAEK